MKKIILGFLVIAFNATMAQNLAYIETDIIMEEMPEFKEAKEEIDNLATQWEAEVEKKFSAVEELYQEYVNSEALLPDDIKKEKQEEIFEAERQAKEYREKKFGKEGELAELQETKIKPIRDQIMEAAIKIGKEKSYDYVFDKSPESSWIYTNPEHNLTASVKTELGL